MPDDLVSSAVPPDNFEQGYWRFQDLVERDSGFPFRSFDEGRIAVWENYKPHLREHALSRLRAGEWTENQICSGEIVRRTIDAIEIQDNRPGGHLNNLLSWQNRWGHANRDHRALLEAEVSASVRAPIERLLFGLYRGGADEGLTFDGLSDLTGRKYPLMAYLYFLKDIDRFMPINPTGFDRAFRAFGVELTTLRQIGWTNYTAYNATLDGLRPLIAKAANLKTVRLVDAHSFCWVFATLLERESQGAIGQSSSSNLAGRVLGGREKAAAIMRWTVENTVKNANGQIVERVLKNKELRMTPEALEKFLIAMLELQGDRCALTGIPLHYDGPDVDKALKPSLDRIDSGGHYEEGNLQVVCQFVNFWKNNSDNEEFKRLLMLVRGETGLPADLA